ncbi:glycosyltransferase N-terminal domain-containing protein [Defluviimonas sp. D31]|uniref:3-deoxy-D-manno-octulosonic acid transferase n=1 Tax=Defluviimonas sp. D31 TaxID=3083253 RepID=UPI00296F4D68|nr:glycosyltransferase N-terminal domain-containing protein [Defluviimonas sp. D31]MDW4548285.1 glycosyltransferase N-terminal domain-containing protein [Defluviimonas sp. D31]
MLLYRLLAQIVFRLYAFRLRLAVATGRLARESFDERLGRGPERDGAAPLIWIHGASNGELASARPVIDTLIARAPDLSVLVTANTETGRALAQSWQQTRLHAALAPLDYPGAVRRFLDRWQPAALVVIENELWPERLTACAARGIPVFVIGARMSARSYRNWTRLRGLTARILGAIRYLSAQDSGSEGRFHDLGLASARIGPVVNLKSATTARNTSESLPFQRETTLLAASTHEGEEAAVLDAFATARLQIPGLALILAPRHPRRRDAVEALIRARGLAFATRSRGARPDRDTPVYLADTMGEMDLWYQAAGMTFVGGSLVDRGGHTPFEPAAHGSAILHGPDTANSAPAYAALTAARAAIEVANASELAAATVALADGEAQARLAAAATAALAPLAAGAALDPFYAALGEATGLPSLAS